MFGRFARVISRWAGSRLAFFLAFALIIGWSATGPLFRYSDSWSLFINTVTTIITFLVGFVILHTQNRDSAAIHAKLDTLIAAVERADNRLIRGEELSEEMVETLRGE